ncbi:MAG: hypothetical protein ACREGI_02365, partial [Candidatus Levyibacteriota bacterium]
MIFIFIKKWSKSTLAGFWGVLLTEFGGGFAFIFKILGHQGISFDNGLGMLQPAVSLVNPPFAISIALLVAGLFSLLMYMETNEKQWEIPLILFFGLITEFKVYAGMVALAGFFLITVIKFFQKKYRFSYLFAAILFLFFITYWRFTGSAGFLILYPLWNPLSLFRQNLSFMLPNIDDKIEKYTQYSVISQLVKVYAIMFGVFIFGNIGTRAFGLLCLFFKKQRQILFSSFSLMLGFMTLVAFFIPLFFIQSIKVFEITQMFNYFLFFVALFSAVGIAGFFSKKFHPVIKVILIALFLVITLPSAYEQLYGYNIGWQSFIVSPATIKATTFLSQQGTYDDTMLVFPRKEIQPKDVQGWYNEEPRLLPLALSNKRGYLSNEDNDFPNLMVEPRIEFLSNLLQ